MNDVQTFAAALQRVRGGLSYRRLADRTHYSHPHLVRATSGRRLPGWELTAAFLTGCGVPPELLPVWYRRWQQTGRDHRDPITLLRYAATPADLGGALTALTAPRSLRTLERLTGIPRATLQAWLRGTRLPRGDRLDHLIRATGATRAERTAAAAALARLNRERQPTARPGLSGGTPPPVRAA